MGVQNCCWVREQSRAQGAARMVMMVLASAADDASNRCAVSVPTLARWAGVDERSIYRALEHLEALGELQITRRTGRVTSYFLPMPAENEAPNPWHSVTPDTVSPLTLDTKRGDTVSQTPDTVSPKKYLKDLKGEKHNIFPFDVDLPAQKPQAKAPPISDEEYKTLGKTFVAPEPGALAAGDLWRKVVEDCRLQFGNNINYHLSDNRIVVLGLEDDTLRIRLATDAAYQQLAGRMQSVINRIAKSIAGRPVQVCFEQEYQPLDVLLGVNR